MRFLWAMLALFGATLAQPVAAQAKGPLVLAAASLQESMTAAADAWARRGHLRPVVSFAASSALARQVEAGAPADLFASADEDWMNALQAKGLITPGTRVDWLTNRLVIVAPRRRARVRIAMTAGALARALGAGPLAMADPGAGSRGQVRQGGAGRTRRMGPQSLRMVVRGESVRAALALVERGAGSVRDRLRDRRPRLAVGACPSASSRRAATRRSSIRLPGSGRRPARTPKGFRRFLLSRSGKAIFARLGFTPR